MSASTVGRWTAAVAVVGLLALDAKFVTTAPGRISVVPNLHVDASTYDAIARNLSRSWSFEAIPPLQPPGFVAFLGLVYTVLGPSWIAGRLALWGCLVLVTVLSALVAHRLYQKESAAWIAALLCASSPALVAYAGTLQYEVLAAALVLSLVLTAGRFADSKRSASPFGLLAAAAIGVGIGLAVLTREVLIVLVPLVSLYLYVRVAAKGSRRWAALISGMCFMCAVAPAAVWSIAQSARHDRVVAVSDKGSVVIALGNNDVANGTFNTPLVGEARLSGWAFIAAHPRAAAWLWVRKAGYFWGILRDGWNVPRPTAIVVANATAGTVPLQWILPWARGGWLLPVFLLALAWWSRGTWSVSWLIPAVVAAVMAVHVVSISSYRFAVPVLPLVLAVTAGPIAGALDVVWRSTRARLVAATIVLLVIGAQLVAWTLVYEVDATEFDGSAAENRYDAAMGTNVRFADASRGRRVVLGLVDEYLPEGALTIRLMVRTDERRADPLQPPFRVAVSTLDSGTVCDHVVNGTRVDEQPRPIEVPCRLEHAGPWTFMVETLGVENLTFGPVRFTWNATAEE